MGTRRVASYQRAAGQVVCVKRIQLDSYSCRMSVPSRSLVFPAWDTVSLHYKLNLDPDQDRPLTLEVHNGAWLLQSSGALPCSVKWYTVQITIGEFVMPLVCIHIC